MAHFPFVRARLWRVDMSFRTIGCMCNLAIKKDMFYLDIYAAQLEIIKKIIIF